VKLSVNFISKGQYFRAFVDDVPDELVPAHVAQWAMKDDIDSTGLSVKRIFSSSEETLTSIMAGSSLFTMQPVYYVKRGTGYVEADLCKDLIPRERLYVKRKTDFKKRKVVRSCC
jgi:hypothetical protein